MDDHADNKRKSLPAVRGGAENSNVSSYEKRGRSHSTLEDLAVTTAGEGENRLIEERKS